MEFPITPRVQALLDEDRISGRSEKYGAAPNASPLTLQELDTMIQEGIDAVDRGDTYNEAEARAYIAAVRALL